MRLLNKKAIITGPAQGLGQQMAYALAEEGCNVAGFDIRAEQLKETGKNIQDMGREFIDLVVDLRDFNKVHKAIDQVFDSWGEVDILINNAGKGQRQVFTEVDLELWNYMIAVNLDSVFNVCSGVVPRMIEKGGGRIVNISSVAAIRGGRLLGKTAYAAAKGGVISFTKSLAYELAPHKITVNCIAPGVQNTPRRANDSKSEREHLMNQIPMKEIGEPSDLAQSVLFLCLPSSGYITGQVLAQDGGHSI